MLRGVVVGCGFERVLSAGDGGAPTITFGWTSDMLRG